MAPNTAAEQQINPNWSVFAPALVAILQAAEKEGANQQRLLRDSGLQQSQLAIPDRRFPVANYYKLYQLAAEASANPDIGLSVGRIIYLKGLNLQLYTCSL